MFSGASAGAYGHAAPRILLVDDDRGLLVPLAEQLRHDGFDVTTAREVKARADLPIIVLSAIDAGDNKADLLDEFAEDYITKPYHYSELRARIQRVLRRVGERVPRPSQPRRSWPTPGPSRSRRAPATRPTTSSSMLPAAASP